MTTWYRYSFDNALVHIVPDSLAEQLVTEMTDRGHPLQDYVATYGHEVAASLGGNPKVMTEWCIDFGGMVHVHQPYETFRVDGLSIEIAADRVDGVAELVAAAPLRHFADGSAYYKLRHWMHATALTRSQATSLAKQLAERAPAAAARSDEFTAALKRGSEKGVH